MIGVYYLCIVTAQPTFAFTVGLPGSPGSPGAASAAAWVVPLAVAAFAIGGIRAAFDGLAVGSGHICGLIAFLAHHHAKFDNLTVAN